MPTWMTSADAADYLSVTEETLARKARAGVIRASKIGKNWRFSRADLDAWMERGGDSVPEIVQKSRRLQDELERVLREVGAATVRELADALDAAPGDVERALRALAAHDAENQTGVGPAEYPTWIAQLNDGTWAVEVARRR